MSFHLSIDAPRIVRAAVVILSLAGLTAAQTFVVDNSFIPQQGTGSSENVDFGDVDLDGDWDAALANGSANPNRLYINQGGLQSGPLGLFLDESDVRLPFVGDSSFDVEFADIDDDGDLDLFVTNTIELDNDSDRWWINVGGKQGGTLGFYADETAQRWIGLGGPGSSIPPGSLFDDGWADFAHDSDFADLDNDGDLDLVHSSMGNPCSGGENHMPTRIFLNDGEGYFQEFNPSGFTPSCGTLSTGEPGLWCDGVYQPKTTDVSGTFCDVTGEAHDVDVGDIDGDFDLDIVLGDVQFRPRVFANRLEGSGLVPDLAGALGFRDVTGLALPAFLDYSKEHEFGDLDRDGDLELAGLDWDGSSADDLVLENPGGGVFANPVQLPGSTGGDTEVDFLDYDNDGDLDAYVANPVGGRLLRNDGSGFTLDTLPDFVAGPEDAEAADTDGDGDYDLLLVVHSSIIWVYDDVFLKNVTQIPDTHAPYLPNVEAIGDQTAAAANVPVRAHVYDNAPYYITWYNATVLEVSVDGVSLPPIEAQSSMGQVFRAELPGNLVGAVDYRFVSSDEYGNTGASALQSYTASTPLTYAVPYGQGTAGTLAGTEPAIAALSVPFGGGTLYLAGHSDAPPGTRGVFVTGLTKYDPPQLVPGIVLANVQPPYFVVQFVTTDANGDAVIAVDVPSVPAGLSAYAQFGAFDPPVTGEALSGSKGLELITQ